MDNKSAGSTSTPDSFNLEGRWAFLAAIEKHWTPSPLSELRQFSTAVTQWLELPARRFFKESFAELSPQDSMELTLPDHSWPWRWPELQHDEAGSEAIRQLEVWRDGFPLHPGDTWVMDAAIHTILSAAILGSWTDEWTYSPPQQARPIFNPGFPSRRLERAEESTAFKRWYIDAMKKQIDEYLGLAVGYHQSVTYAEWTARSWSGETAQSILNSLNAKNAARRTVGSIQKDIQRFARSVGLTRPKNGCRTS